MRPSRRVLRFGVFPAAMVLLAVLQFLLGRTSIQALAPASQLLNFAVHAVVASPLVLVADGEAVTPKALAWSFLVTIAMVLQVWSLRVTQPDVAWPGTLLNAFLTAGLWTALAAAATLVVLHLWKPETAA